VAGTVVAVAAAINQGCCGYAFERWYSGTSLDSFQMFGAQFRQFGIA
jgi:hypothetical protein